MISAILVVVVFLAGAALDFAAYRYGAAVADMRPRIAARWSVAMYLIGLVGFVSVLDVSRWYALPECAGLYVGTLIAGRNPRQ